MKKYNNINKEYFYLYKITNSINGMIYYGVHGTNKLEDGYMGSGSALYKAKIEYGIENFKKEIIEFFDNADDMSATEKLIVTKIFVKDPNNYNRKPGGGFLNYGKRVGVRKSPVQRISKDELFKILSKAQKKYISTLSKEIISARMAHMGRKAHWDEKRKNVWKNNLSIANKDNENCSIASKKVWENYTDEEKITRNKKISNATIERYSTISKKDKIEMLSSATEASKRRIVCPHCGKDANTGNYGRWHGDKCKYRGK